MLTATSAEMQRDFALWRDRARQQPVGIVQNGRPEVIMLSAEEYQRLKRRDREALRVEELDDATLSAIAAAEPPAEASRHDAEVT